MGVQEGLATLLLEHLQQLFSLIFQVLDFLDTLAQLTDEECSKDGFFAVVWDVHIDHVHKLASLLFSGIQIFYHLVVNSLFANEDQIKQIVAVLELFRMRLDSLIFCPAYVKCHYVYRELYLS
jgi:hypothetical protein